MSVIKLIGSDPNQVSRNRDLGSLAFQDAENVIVDNLQADGNVIVDGNVGIGTIAPSETLSVVKPIVGDVITWTNGGASAKKGFLYSDNQYVGMMTIGGAGNNQGILFDLNNNKTIIQRIGGTTATFDSAGNVGIGTIAPSTTLSVAGTAPVITIAPSSGTASSTITLSNPSQSWQLENQYVGGASVGMFRLRDATAGTDVLTVNPSSTAVTLHRNTAVTGTLSITDNLVIGTSGKGIDFSATPGTGTSELLDDYEEGTWTPIDSSGAGLVFTSASGTYTKIGKLCYITGALTFPATASVSTATIGGLPFSVSGGTQYNNYGPPIRNNKSLSMQPFGLNTSSFLLLPIGNYTNYVTNVDMTSGTMLFSFTYQTV